MDNPTPVVIGFLRQTEDRLLISQLLESVAINVRWIGSEDELTPLSEAKSLRVNEPGENIYGSSGALVDLLAKEQPAMLIFSQGNEGIPWAKWLPMLKRSPATRRTPVVMLADQWSEDENIAAQKLGVSFTLERAEVAEKIIALVQEHGRIPDYSGIASACDEALDPRGKEGIDAYNAGEYYDAHEFLEYAWKDDKGLGRDLYRSILQIAVALYQVQRGNYNGAIKMLLRVQQWLKPLPASCRGVDVAALREDAANYYSAVVELGPDRISEFDWSSIRPVLLK